MIQAKISLSTTRFVSPEDHCELPGLVNNIALNHKCCKITMSL